MRRSLIAWLLVTRRVGCLRGPRLVVHDSLTRPPPTATTSHLFPSRSEHMVNVWGYSHISFFSPMVRFSGGGGGPAAAARDFKTMVKE